VQDQVHASLEAALRRAVRGNASVHRLPPALVANRPADYYIGEETRRLIAKIVYWLVRDHYELPPGEGVPIVPYDPHHGRSHRFSSGPYLFQHDRRALSDDTLGVCLRFLLHRMVFYTRDGKPVAITPHLLRHVFATHAVQVEKVRQLYEEAHGKVGALAEVIGGQCVQAGFCPAKFACIGTSTPSAEAPAWLGAVYSARRERTTDLLRTSIDTLQKQEKPVSITSVVAVSRQLDPLGKGVSESALLHNPEARAHYEAHRTWNGGRTGQVITRGRASEPTRVKPDRDLARARRRYLRLSKRELAERLLTVEQACAEYEQHWLRTADELFTWMLLVVGRA
jgi:hypothetical protein